MVYEVQSILTEHVAAFMDPIPIPCDILTHLEALCAFANSNCSGTPGSVRPGAATLAGSG